MSHSYLNEFVSTVKDQVQGFISVAVVITEFGNVVASETAPGSEGAEQSAIFQAEIYKQAVKSIDALNATETDVKEILITSEDRIFIICSASKGKFLAILQVNSKKSNLGIAKTVIVKNLKNIEADLDRDF